jgi:TatD DNase family protein
MIDTHAHLSERFCDPAVSGQVLNGELTVILAGSNLTDSRENIELANNSPKLWASVGIHPQCTDPENLDSIDKQLVLLEDIVKSNDKIAAIGECGLDYSPPPPEERERSKEEQEKLFLGQIKIAQKYKKPLIIHARKAVDEVIEILNNYENLSGVFHCYAGGKKRIQKILDLGEGFYFGIDGNLTYEVGLAEVVMAIPKEKLILETDSPFLTPMPFRGQVNKPEYVKYIYEKMAEIWKTNLCETEKIIDGNARKLFNVIGE